MVIVCGPFEILSDFDSGNCLRAEIVSNNNSSPIAQLRQSADHIDHELNIWTKPDCYGTPFENGNRTWFYFGIKGGSPHGILKVNVLNLNKQIKLFNQGMQPVFRVLPNGKNPSCSSPSWQRIKDRLLINEAGETGVCNISFKHRLPDDIENSTLYFAFTYPYSYMELLESLDYLETKYKVSNQQQYQQQQKIPRREGRLASSLAYDEIYFHREVVCYSLERRNVELITITSLYGASKERETRLVNLFPDQKKERPLKFPGKKIIFLSSRVHPGETPSSFVLNGFIKFVLDESDPRASLLRRFFVFKIFPFLNPDGVVQGHYRSDPRGINLNRVYLHPSPTLHPSIYAARKLLLYYHSGVESPDDYDAITSENIKSESSERKLITSTNAKDIKRSNDIKLLLTNEDLIDCNSSAAEFETDVDFPNVGVIASNSKKKYTTNELKVQQQGLTSPEKSNTRICAGCCDELIEVETPSSEACSNSNSCSSNSQFSVRNIKSLSLSNQPKIIFSKDNNQHQCAYEACDEDSVVYENDRQNNLNNNLINVSESNSNGPPLVEKQGAKPKPAANKRKGRRQTSKRSSSSIDNNDEPKKSRSKKSVYSTENVNISPVANIGFLTNSKKSPKYLTKIFPSLYAQQNYPSTSHTIYELNNRNLRSTNNSIFNQNQQQKEENSGLFLYIDMHGHATKRGIFMYGNHFSDINKQAEAMVIPKLMSINSPHFDFSACNFTERLMNLKDRKDGASREGSGRVACLKLTGLVQSYTLECNYNTGRIVNHVPQNSFDPPFSQTPIPPKFCPTIFEGIGKALGESILDVVNQNPWSRLKNTDMKNIDGVRRFLIKRLKVNSEYKNNNSSIVSPLETVNVLPVLTNSKTSTKKPKTKNLKISNKLGGPLGYNKQNNQNNISSSPTHPSSSSRPQLDTSSTLTIIKPIKGGSKNPSPSEIPDLSKTFKSKKKKTVSTKNTSTPDGNKKGLKKKKAKKVETKNLIESLKSIPNSEESESTPLIITDENSAISLPEERDDDMPSNDLMTDFLSSSKIIIGINSSKPGSPIASTSSLSLVTGSTKRIGKAQQKKSSKLRNVKQKRVKNVATGERTRAKKKSSSQNAKASSRSSESMLSPSHHFDVEFDENAQSDPISLLSINQSSIDNNFSSTATDSMSFAGVILRPASNTSSRSSE